MSAIELPASDVPDRLDEEAFLLDVRREADFETWHIDGAYNMPIYDDLLDGTYSTLEDSLGELPQDREILVMCVAGVTSARAAAFLREQGYDAKNVSGGIRAWGTVYRPYEVEGLPVTQVVRPGTGCVSYLVADGGEALLVDPGLHVDVYRDLLRERDLTLVGAVDTHAHADHVSGGPTLAREFDVPYYLHEADSGTLDEYTPVSDGEVLTVGEHDLDVLHTPGHTPGSVSLRVDGGLLSGDTLFIRGVGRPDLEDADEAAVREAAGELFDSLGRVLGFDDETVVLPGHFSDESIRPLATTLGALRSDNDLVGIEDREAFVEQVIAGLSETPANYQRIKRINWGQEPLTEEAADLELGPNNCAAN